MKPALPDTGARLDALDALRAAALMGGVLLHAALPFLLPPGIWAVGTHEPQPVIGWLVYYLHCFRLEVFFLLAGFFGSLVVRKRGVKSYLRDRAMRILLVFAVVLYPMKFLLSALWIAGGRLTGWLVLPPEIAGRPWYELAIGSFFQEKWPAISLTHLWFLYVLSGIVAVFLAARAVAARAEGLRSPAAAGSGLLHRTVSSPLWPVLFALALTPVIAAMEGMDIDTPDRSFAWKWPVMSLYLILFSLGWWIEGNRDLLDTFRRRRYGFLALGLAASFLGSGGITMRYGTGEWVTAYATELRWATSLLTSLTLAGSAFGWLGAFLSWFPSPSKAARYLADSSYWVYIVHLPIVVGLQVTMASSGLPSWIQVPLTCIVTLAVAGVTYHWMVRRTWIGAWLNGRRKP